MSDKDKSKKRRKREIKTCEKCNHIYKTLYCFHCHKSPFRIEVNNDYKYFSKYKGNPEINMFYVTSSQEDNDSYYDDWPISD